MIKHDQQALINFYATLFGNTLKNMKNTRKSTLNQNFLRGESDVDVEIEGNKIPKQKHGNGFNPCKKHDNCRDHHPHCNKWDGNNHNHCHNEKECECKARLRDSMGPFTISADICPHCDNKKSEVTAAIDVGVNILFKSKEITKPICSKVFSTDGSAVIGTSMNVGGVGKVLFDSETFDAAFTLSMFESLGIGNQDAYVFSITFIGSSGSLNFILVTNTATPDQNLIIRKCNNKHCSCDHHHRFDGFHDFDDDFDSLAATTANASDISAPTRAIIYTKNGVDQSFELHHFWYK